MSDVLQAVPVSRAGVLDRGPLSPVAMADHLRRTGGDAAPCFAQAMYEDAAWANESWGAYWAEIVRLV